MKYSNLKKNFKANETLVCTICVLCRSTVTVLLWEFVLNLRGNLPQSMINKAGWGIETSREALRTISNAACLLNHCTYSQACEVMRINFDSCADKKTESWAEEENWIPRRRKNWILHSEKKTESCTEKKNESWAEEKNWILHSVNKIESCADWNSFDKHLTEYCALLQ